MWVYLIIIFPRTPPKGVAGSGREGKVGARECVPGGAGPATGASTKVSEAQGGGLSWQPHLLTSRLPQWNAAGSDPSSHGDCRD